MSKNRLSSETIPSNGVLMEGLLLADAAGVIRFATPPAEQLFGRSSRDLVGKSLAELLIPADRPGAQKKLATAVARPGLSLDGVYTLRPTDNTQTRLETVITCLPDQPDSNTVVVNVRPAAFGEKFRALYELSPDAIILAGADTGIIVDANPAAAKLLQRPHNQIIGMHFTALHPPDHVALAQEGFTYRRAAAEEDTPPIEHDVICGDGSRKPVEIRARAITLDGQTYMLGVFRDITERKQAEQVLRRYQHMISASPSALALVDRNYVYRIVNDIHLSLNNRASNEIIDHSVAEVVGTELFEQISKPHLDRCFNGETVRYQAWLDIPVEGRRFMDITYAPYRDDDNTIGGALVSARDITNLSRTEEALRESESRFRAVWEITSDALVLSDSEGTVLAANPAYVTLYGYPSEQIIGKSIAAVFPPHRRAEILEHYRAIFEAPEPSLSFESEIVRANGTRRLVEAQFSFITHNTYRVAMLSTIRDITERKQKEEQIKAALAEKEVLLRELYHRTKNNMQVIGSLLSLQATQAKSASVSTVFKEMETRIRAMALVHQKLYQSQNLSSIDLKEYISDLAMLLARSYRLDMGRVSLTLELEPVPVLIDTAIPCGLILHELISNAFKHAFPNTRRGEIKICLNKTNDDIMLQVSDNGVGLPAGFDPRQSQTLGLQTILGIGEHQLQGRVNLKNEPGVTCTIEFKDNLYQVRI